MIKKTIFTSRNFLCPVSGACLEKSLRSKGTQLYSEGRGGTSKIGGGTLEGGVTLKIQYSKTTKNGEIYKEDIQSLTQTNKKARTKA